ncbi:MAG: hypothetical protein ACPL7E_02745 [bacterium]
MRRAFPFLFLAALAFSLEVSLPPYLKTVESTALPQVLIQALFGDYGKQIDKLEILIVEGDKSEALQFWQQTLPSNGWRLLFSSQQPQQPFPIAYSKGNNIFLIAPGVTTKQLLLVEAEGVKDVGVLLGIIMKGLTTIATSLVQEKEKVPLPRIPSFPQAKLTLEARIPAKLVSEKLKGAKEGQVEQARNLASKSARAPSPLLSSLLSSVDEIHFREFQLPSKVSPREVINYYEGKLKSDGWQMMVKNIEPQPSFPYVLICGLKGDYAIISLIPLYPNNRVHTLDEIILLTTKK